LPYALEKHLLFFGAFSGAQLLRREPPDRYVFNFRASYEEETAAAVKYLIKTRKIRPEAIAVFAQQDGYGDSGFRGVARVLREFGREREQILRVGHQRNSAVVEPAVAEILRHPEIKAVVMVTTYIPAARFIAAVKKARPDMVFSNVSFVGSDALAEELRNQGPGLAAGVINTQVVPPVDSQATAVIRFREQLQTFYPNERPSYVSLEGYLDGVILEEGLRRAGPNLTTETLIDALESIKNFDLGIGAPITYGLSQHQGSHRVWATVLDADGRLQELDLD
jgi:ABC-type branched-subunit amino acid transport system substrate-binding protein